MTVRNQSRRHLPLEHGDTERLTVGCRHTNPGICAKHSLNRVCAFVRADNICQSPPASWPKQFRRLSYPPQGDA